MTEVSANARHSAHSAPETAAETPKLAFIASSAPEAQTALHRLQRRYGYVPPSEADIIIALGGDGVMLQTLHEFMGSKTPIYGMNRGSIGFLMNEYREKDLIERLAQAKLNIIHPLRMSVVTETGEKHEALAINEVHLFRLTNQAARLKIEVDDQERMSELVCDGILLATPAGSTAYNLSVGGPILPIKAKLLALTPISPFRPRRWRGALLPNKARVRITVLEHQKRPVSAVADHREVRNVVSVDIREERDLALRLLFDQGHALEERILAEQFRF